MHDELHELVRLVELDEPIVIRMRHEPDAASARLLVALGAGWIVDERAPVCARRCGRKECKVTVAAAEAFKTCEGCQWYGACTKDGMCWAKERERQESEHRVRADERRAERLQSSTSKRLAANEERRVLASETNGSHASDVDGLELLERMDAGEPVGLEEAPAEPARAATGVSSSPDETGLAQPAPTPEGERHRRSSAGGEARTTPRAKRGELQAAILAMLAEGPKNTAVIATRRGITRKNAEVAIYVLRKKGLVQRVRPGLYALSDSGREPAAERATPEDLPSGIARVDVAPEPTGKPASRPDEAPPVPEEREAAHAFALAAIAAARTFADTLEQELAT